ncbi:MAG: hypothetical protein ABR975_07165 [Vulcanimicrobiaceae bacterium]
MTSELTAIEVGWRTPLEIVVIDEPNSITVLALVPLPPLLATNKSPALSSAMP